MKATDKPLPALPRFLPNVRGRKANSQTSSVYSETETAGNASNSTDVPQHARQHNPPVRPARPAFGLFGDGDTPGYMTEHGALRTQLHDLEVENKLLLKQLDDMRIENCSLKKAVKCWQSTAEVCQRTLKDIMGYVVLVVSENRKRLKDTRADFGGDLARVCPDSGGQDGRDLQTS